MIFEIDWKAKGELIHRKFHGIGQKIELGFRIWWFYRVVFTYGATDLNSVVSARV